VRHLTHHGRVRLPAAYVAGHVELLYATTTHRAQGSTVDTAHPLITAGMTRENLYVLASRARERTTFYVSTHDLPFHEDDRVDLARTDPRAYAAREILLTIIATEGAPLSATETIATAQQEAGIARHPRPPLPARRLHRRRAALRGRGPPGTRRRRARCHPGPGLERRRPPAVRRRVRRLGPGATAVRCRRIARARHRPQRRRGSHLAPGRLPGRQPRTAGGRPAV
jgi:hypothetical protein